MWSNPDFKKKMSEQRKAQWADPIKRAEMIKKRKETKSKNPYCNKKIAARWQDPEFIKKWMLARHKKFFD